jgi:xylulokinase
MSEASATSAAGAPHAATLGIDLGTSAVKVVAVGFDGGLIGEGAASFSTLSILPHQAEQAPADWLQALSSAMQALRRSVGHAGRFDWSRRIAAIGLTGQLPTLVCLSDHGPVAPAITWQDGRADAWAAARVSACRAHLYERTGMPIDGRYLAPMLQFHFAARGEVRSILSAKDYLLSVLTGLRATEPSTAAGYGVYDLQEQCFSKDLCEFWNLSRTLLPQLLPANSLAGPLGEAGAALLGLPAGIPVSTGAADSVCAAYAMAGLDEGVVSVGFGSSAVIIGATAGRRLDRSARYLVTPHVVDGWYGREMDLLASGTGYRWLSELFGWQDGGIDEHAAESIPGARGLCFPPYLGGGEQGALWNPRLHGAIVGLTLRHSRSDIARAYLEGVFYEIRRCIEVLAETTPVESLRVSGNLVHSQSSTQMLADIVQRPVGTVAGKSPAAIGAALLARRIVGVADRSDAHRGVAHRADDADRLGGRATVLRPTISPDPPTAAAYTALYGHYVARAAQCE